MSGGNSSKEPDLPLSWYHLRWVLLIGQSRIRAGTPRHCGQTFGQPEMVRFCKLAILPLPSSPRKSPQGGSCIQPFGQPEMVRFLHATLATESPTAAIAARSQDAIA